jgi:hypothetical protein
MKKAVLALTACCLLGQQALAQSPGRWLAAHTLVAVAAVPYCVDLAWQLPLGGRVGWLTTAVPNPDDAHSPARVFLLRGSGTVFTPGYGALCTRLRLLGIWAEDLGPTGDRWLCRHLVDEQRAGRLHGAIVLVGHSRGGRHVIEAARELHNASVAVDLLVCLDVALPPTVPANVRRALNLYMSRQFVYPSDTLKPDDELRTCVENVDLNLPGSPVDGQGLHHLNVTASPAVQDFIVARILQIAHDKRQR